MTSVHCEYLLPGENIPDVPDELWLRACFDTPNLIDPVTGVVSNLMFAWGTLDDGKLSGARSRRTTPGRMYQHLTQVNAHPVHHIRGLVSASLWMLELHLHDDFSILQRETLPLPGHAYLDVQHLARGGSHRAKIVRETVRARLLHHSRVVHESEAGSR